MPNRKKMVQKDRHEENINNVCVFIYILRNNNKNNHPFRTRKKTLCNLPVVRFDAKTNLNQFRFLGSNHSVWTDIFGIKIITDVEMRLLWKSDLKVFSGFFVTHSSDLKWNFSRLKIRFSSYHRILLQTNIIYFGTYFYTIVLDHLFRYPS